MGTPWKQLVSDVLVLLVVLLWIKQTDLRRHDQMPGQLGAGQIEGFAPNNCFEVFILHVPSPERIQFQNLDIP